MLEERKRYIIDFQDVPADRARMPELPADDRIKNYDEIEKGFTLEQAQREAKRCLSCRRCLGCKLCLAACEKEAIDFDQMDEQRELVVDSIIITPGSIKTTESLDERFGYGRSANVVTDLEFERILHPEGPYGGLVLRPSDGEIPAKIGFIYSDEKALNPSSLRVILKEAAAARKKIEGCDVWLFLSHPIEAEDYRSCLDHIPDLTLKTCVVKSVEEIEESGNLVVGFQEEGERRSERFQMLVVSSQLRIPASIKTVAEGLGLQLAQRSDCEEESQPHPTDKTGISLAGGITTG